MVDNSKQKNGFRRDQTSKLFTKTYMLFGGTYIKIVWVAPVVYVIYEAFASGLYLMQIRRNLYTIFKKCLNVLFLDILFETQAGVECFIRYKTRGDSRAF